MLFHVLFGYDRWPSFGLSMEAENMPRHTRPPDEAPGQGRFCLPSRCGTVYFQGAHQRQGIEAKSMIFRENAFQFTSSVVFQRRQRRQWSATGQANSRAHHRSAPDVRLFARRLVLKHTLAATKTTDDCLRQYNQHDAVCYLIKRPGNSPVCSSLRTISVPATKVC